MAVTVVAVMVVEREGGEASNRGDMHEGFYVATVVGERDLRWGPEEHPPVVDGSEGSTGNDTDEFPMDAMEPSEAKQMKAGLGWPNQAQA